MIALALGWEKGRGKHSISKGDETTRPEGRGVRMRTLSGRSSKQHTDKHNAGKHGVCEQHAEASCFEVFWVGQSNAGCWMIEVERVLAGRARWKNLTTLIGHLRETCACDWRKASVLSLLGGWRLAAGGQLDGDRRGASGHGPRSDVRRQGEKGGDDLQHLSHHCTVPTTYLALLRSLPM